MVKRRPSRCSTSSPARSRRSPTRRAGEQEAAERALLRARELDELEARLEEAIAVSRETARFSPSRRRARGPVDFYAEAAAQIDLAIRNVRVLARGVLRALGSARTSRRRSPRAPRPR